MNWPDKKKLKVEKIDFHFSDSKKGALLKKTNRRSLATLLFFTNALLKNYLKKVQKINTKEQYNTD